MSKSKYTLRLYISIYFLYYKYNLSRDSGFLVLRRLFSFLFGQNLFSSCDFRPDIVEASNIMADVLRKH